MRGIFHIGINALSGLLLLGCVTTETRSVVSTQDLPPAKYQKLVVFVENLGEAEQFTGEQILVSAFADQKISAVASMDLFMGRGDLDPDAKAAFIREQGFDGALYVSVTRKGVEERIVEGAWFDGMLRRRIGPLIYSTNSTDGYIIKSDGSVAETIFVLDAKSELQDVTSAKTVWQADTSAYSKSSWSNIRLVFEEASKEMITKMRKDQAI